MIRRWTGLPCLIGAVVAGTVGALWLSGMTFAEDTVPGTKPKPAAEAKDGEKPAKEGEKPEAKPEVKPVDPFEVPEGTDSKVLNLFLSRLQRTPPKSRTPEGITEYLGKLEKVADELHSRELDDQMTEQAFGMKIQILSLLPQFGDETATKRRGEFLAKAVDDKRPVVAKMAQQFVKLDRVKGIAGLEQAERTALIQELAKDIQEGELSNEEIEIATIAGDALAEGDKSEEAAAAMNLFAKYIESSGRPNAAKLAGSMRGTARRLGLLGNPIEIAGTKIDGTEFKIEELKGKVVLVDFWATWCGPCIGELPNVKESYELYHDKGFEVVGISLDKERDELEEFLKAEKLPWIQLHQNDGSGWGNDNAVRYWIKGIPSCFLVDKDGKVVSVSCRGPELPKMLAKLLGPVEKKPALPKKPAKDE